MSSFDGVKTLLFIPVPLKFTFLLLRQNTLFVINGNFKRATGGNTWPHNPEPGIANESWLYSAQHGLRPQA